MSKYTKILQWGLILIALLNGGAEGKNETQRDTLGFERCIKDCEHKTQEAGCLEKCLSRYENWKNF
jgi:hypothetical protein